MIELYLDTADVAEVKRFNQCLPLKGVTTNPSILAKSKQGLNETLAGMQEALGGTPRFHAQVVSSTVEGMVAEARQLNELPYDMVVKVPATETGLAAIKLMKKEGIQVLATAIYSAQQGFLAALCGADYLAPYVNRIDAMNGNGVEVVADLQLLLAPKPTTSEDFGSQLQEHSTSDGGDETGHRSHYIANRCGGTNVRSPSSQTGG